ncbi:PaaX family transcriptional regulator [Nocardioides massiliensis]|uniref:Phenylacetic acid degradation operon negative regulatory protein n=1 Tax=Nocardioides massiliensis TaxID=1325935 RepID=A0ABT9NUQ0_9ACTN|nr:PaaX family transcriptional regulator C-terminal domain-containing protein [Nocardioides massiliensis]MDP9824158.1 phenylacetic acid degradation operon negative regulatory protein [Nocardioides massiliensis]
MHARSALFDLYGDHLLARGGQAPVAALVRLLAPLDVAAPAVRTAVSRMVRQGWLTPVALPAGAGYAVTERARERLVATAARIYRSETEDWDGTWDVVTLGRFPGRGARDRVRRALGFLGYAPLADGTWIAARASSEVRGVLGDEGVSCVQLRATVADSDLATVRGLWDLETLARDYVTWQDEARALLSAGGGGVGDGDEAAFAVRSRLLHSWRKFLFADPGLPPALLPADWPGHDARRLFEDEAARLLPAARRFVDSVLDPPGDDLVSSISSPTHTATATEEP